MSVSFATPKIRVPPGFENLLEAFTREILREQPQDIISFGAEFFRNKLKQRVGGSWHNNCSLNYYVIRQFLYAIDGVYVEQLIENEEFLPTHLAEAHTVRESPGPIERTDEVKHLASDRIDESDTQEESIKDGSITEESATEEVPEEGDQDRQGETVADNEVPETQSHDVEEEEGGETEDIPPQEDDIM